MNRRVAIGLTLVGILLACFSRLVAEPASLIVDADHPSIDHARPRSDLSTGNDLTRLFLPHHLGIARQIARTGHPPLWDDRGFGGRPMVGNPQASLFYPPAWLAWGTGWPSALGWITVGHLLWSSLGAYRLARTVGMGEAGSLMAAGCVQLSPYVIAQAFEGHYPHVWGASWYPWAFEAAIRLRRSFLSDVAPGFGRGLLDSSESFPRREGDPEKAAAWLAAILSACFLTGHPQEGAFLLIALGLWASFDGLVAIGSGRGRSGIKFWSAWARALILAAGLMAIELIPDEKAQAWALRGTRLPIHLAGQYHLEVANLLQLLSPRALGGPSEYFGHENYWEALLSIGLVPGILSIVGLAWSLDRRGVRGWLILVVGAILFASGRKLGLFPLFYHIVPGMDRFRVPARSLFLASLGLSMLAGMGVDSLRARSGDDLRWRKLGLRWLSIAVGLTAMTLAGKFGSGWIDTSFVQPGSNVGRVPELNRWILGLARLSTDPVFWGALGFSTVTVGWAACYPSSRRKAALILGGIGLIELTLYGHDLIRISPADRFLGPNPIGQALHDHRPPVLEPPRIRAVDDLYSDVQSGRDGFAKANVNDSFQIQHAAELYEPLYRLFTPERDDRGAPMDRAVANFRREVRKAVLDRMSIPLLVSDRRTPGGSWPVLASGSSEGRPYFILKNPTSTPRAYVVPRAELTPDDASTVAHFRRVDPRQAVLMPDDPLSDAKGPRQPFMPAEWTSDDPDRVVIRVQTEAPGLLVIADTWMPGWSALVDAVPARILKGNRAQRVIPLPEAGRHEIILTYRPPGLIAGMAITAASLLIAFGLRAGSLLRRLSSTRPASAR
ncbi:hypothetical protein P12x_003480 [Tundrisphaera lichenicola]|uniref:hypothetical protein n=1 Tax=Tundrisphaera lichenicola TaxID=2029860 RepID=UPI003EBB1671